MKNLRLLRKNKDLTMKQLGEYFGLAESTIALYESGKRQPDNDMMIKIADYFGVSVDYLLGRDETPTQDIVLSEDEKAVLDLFNQVPADKQDLVLQMIRVALENSK